MLLIEVAGPFHAKYDIIATYMRTVICTVSMLPVLFTTMSISSLIEYRVTITKSDRG